MNQVGAEETTTGVGMHRLPCEDFRNDCCRNINFFMTWAGTRKKLNGVRVSLEIDLCHSGQSN